MISENVAVKIISSIFGALVFFFNMSEKYRKLSTLICGLLVSFYITTYISEHFALPALKENLDWDLSIFFNNLFSVRGSLFFCITGLCCQFLYCFFVVLDGMTNAITKIDWGEFFVRIFEKFINKIINKNEKK